MFRTPLIIANWKMFKTTAEAKEFISKLLPLVRDTDRKTFLAVPFPSLEGSVEMTKGAKVHIGVQNIHDQEEGAFTGEVSAEMVKASGASFAIIGHSERRRLFSESNPFIHRKLKRALETGLTPVLCIGETLQERENNATEAVLRLQLEECLEGILPHEIVKIVIAYEPVWAIGTGKNATPEMAQSVHRFIRSFIVECFDEDTAGKISLLYGGSVKPDNTAALMEQPDIDGVLVGGASLEVSSFSQIVNY